MSDDLGLYYGAASGQQRSALQRLEPEGVMISHATANNTPWDGSHDTFVDCGGYHHMMNGSGDRRERQHSETDSQPNSEGTDAR